MSGNESSTAIATALPSYLTLKTMANVLVKVPENGPQMKLVQAHTFEASDGSVPVETHRQNGAIVQQKPQVIVTRHFFVDEDNLGKKICATVKIVEKTLSDGRKFILLDIRPCEPDQDAPFFVMKFKKSVERGTPIPRTNHFLQFNRTAPPSK